MAEFPHVGKRCSVENCQLLDFLPFTCDVCNKIYCLEHRTAESHGCERSSRNTVVEHAPIQQYPCSFNTCAKTELVEITCEDCGQNFCLKHRHGQDHQCAKLTNQTTVLKPVIAHVNDIRPPPKCRGRKSDKTSMQVTLMKMKMKAVGDSAVPIADRVYFHILLPSILNEEKSRDYYFSKEWTVGKLIDYVAEKEKIPNRNNTSSNTKLRLILLEDESELLANQQLITLITNGVNNGSSLQLKLC